MKSTYKELKAQAEKLAEQAEAARIEELKEVASRVAKELNEYEISLADLRAAGYKVGEAFPVAKPPKAKVAPSGFKYQDPKSPENGWSGRGRMPFWLKALVDAGQDKEQYKIN